MNKNNAFRFLPLLLAVSVIIGIAIGTFYANLFPSNQLTIKTNSNKINDLLRIIDAQYVDTVNMEDLVEDAMPLIVSELDPHSTYIKASEAQASVDDLKGSFSGVGITFSIQNDTINVINVIKGGPCEKVGILAGDRIIRIDGMPFVGDSVTNDLSMKKLKGPKGTTVELGIKRNGEPKPLNFTVVRGDIPVHSVEAAYMIDDIGYIKIDKFGETTYPELLVALAKLNQAGFEGLIIDLRGNQGGYMHTAIQMANIFLPKNRLIVYTEGRNSPREDYLSDGRGAFPHLPLIVLIDEVSASASEIFAGAIQDNDRGTVIGRRSFGKGLVQQPIEFRDHSIIRLTIARYHTPSGRCIQKPYEKGHGAEYEKDLLERYERGEFFSEDSIHQEGEQFTTRSGRIVYGNGGIMPDIFIPEDTSDVTSYYKEAVISGFMHQFSYKFADDHRETLTAMKDNEAFVRYLKQQNVINQFANFAQQRGLKRRNIMIYKSKKLFERNLYGMIINNIRETVDFYRHVNSDDPTILRALEVMNAGNAFPAPPANNEPQPDRHE